MWTWIAEHSAVVTAITAIVTAVIWAVYLHLLLSTTMRSRRPMILLSRSAGKDERARLLISNMSAEPIYVTRLIADMEMDDGTSRAIITESTDINQGEGNRAASTEGPLTSGSFMDAGDFGSLMERIDRRSRPPIEGRTVNRLTLTLVCAYGHGASISAGRRSFGVVRRGGRTFFIPETEGTLQLRGILQRRRLKSELDTFLRQEHEEIRARVQQPTGPGGDAAEHRAPLTGTTAESGR